MCGITGIIHLNGERASRRAVQAMSRAIRHRGPDGEGAYVDGPVGFGHTRLAMVDLTDQSAQPMVQDGGRWVLVYNGEIYNYRELRRELMEEGCRFVSTGDTEVLLWALRQWGEQAVERLNGMFAFALWDNERRELLLGRDRYGIKPLYVSRRDDAFLFGSEIKAILGHPRHAMDIDLEGLVEYFTFQNFFSEHTLFKGVHTFPPGFTMRIGPASPLPVWRRYWDFKFEDAETGVTEAEYIDELDRLMRIAVKRQLMGDVEIGSYLSGGMDSGTISCLASEGAPDYKTFTCGFDMHSISGLELYFDEREKAEHMSYLLGTEHYQVVLKAGDMERALPSIVYHLDEPRVGQSYPNYYAAKLASRFVKGVLAGTGGDELFAGYPWRYYRTASSKSFEEFIDNYYRYWQRLIPNREIRKVFSPIWKAVGHVWTRDIFRDVFNGNGNDVERPEDYINHSLYFEAKTFLHGLLVVEDKLSMAHGLESRLPFLDNDLVDFALKIPIRYKLGNLGEVMRVNENDPVNKVEKYFKDTRDGKLILRKAMSRHIQHSITNGKKQGFSGPDASWFKGDSIRLVEKKIFSDSARMFDYMDRDSVQSLVREHIEGRTNRRLLIWSLLHFEQWLHQFMG